MHFGLFHHGNLGGLPGCITQSRTAQVGVRGIEESDAITQGCPQSTGSREYCADGFPKGHPGSLCECSGCCLEPVRIILINRFDGQPKITTLFHEVGGLCLVVPGQFRVSCPFGHGREFTHTTEGDPLNLLQSCKVLHGYCRTPPLRVTLEEVNHPLIECIRHEAGHCGAVYVRQINPVFHKPAGHFIVTTQERIEFPHPGERTDTRWRADALDHSVKGQGNLIHSRMHTADRGPNPLHGARLCLSRYNVRESPHGRFQCLKPQIQPIG